MDQKAAANNMTEQRGNEASGSLRESAEGEAPPSKLQPQISFAERQIAKLAEEEFQKRDKESTFQKKFNLAMGGVIIANVFWIALEMDFGPEEGVAFADRVPWFLINSIFLLTFVIEIFVRIHWERSKWHHGFWNWFDTFVVTCAVIDSWLLPILESQTGNLHVLSVLRLARLIRLVRMVKVIKNLHQLYVMVMSFLHALRSMCFLGVIMLFGMLIYAILATVIIGKNDVFKDVRIMDDSVEDRFGKVYRSMYSLFELMTLEGWQMVARPLVEKQPLLFLFIGSFLMIFTYGMLNMVVATVVEKTLEQTATLKEYDTKKDMEKLKEELTSMKVIFTEGDLDGSESLTKEEFQAALMDSDTLRESFLGLGIPFNDVVELFHVLDLDGNNELTINELVDGVGKLKASHLSVWDGLSTEATVKQVMNDVAHLKDKVRAVTIMQANMEARVSEQDELVRQVAMAISGGQAHALPFAPNLIREAWY